MAVYFAFVCGCHGQQVRNSTRTRGVYVHQDGSVATQVRSVRTGDDSQGKGQVTPSRPV